MQTLDPKLKMILQIAHSISGAILETYDKPVSPRIRERADSSPSPEVESESNVGTKPIRERTLRQTKS